MALVVPAHLGGVAGRLRERLAAPSAARPRHSGRPGAGSCRGARARPSAADRPRRARARSPAGAPPAPATAYSCTGGDPPERRSNASIRRLDAGEDRAEAGARAPADEPDPVRSTCGSDWSTSTARRAATTVRPPPRAAPRAAASRRRAGDATPSGMVIVSATTPRAAIHVAGTSSCGAVAARAVEVDDRRETGPSRAGPRAARRPAAARDRERDVVDA